MQRRTSALATSLLALAGCGGSTVTARPNVVLVTLDTTRPDYLSCYDPRRPPTPALDGLAAAGVRFERAQSTSGVTPVSHASILTGRFPFQHGLRVLSAGSGFRLGEEQVTIAHTLRAAGYATAAVHSAFPVSGYFGFQRDFDHFDSFDGALQWNPDLHKTSWEEHLQRRSDETVARVLAYLDEQRAAGSPVFLWIHLWDPHDPNLLPPKEYLSHIEAAGAGAEANAANSPLYEQVYAAEVRFMDRQIGALVEGMHERGLSGDTLMVVTADHGEGLSDGFARHGWGKHRMNYQEQLHVPLIVRGPGIAPRVVPDMVSSVDIVPTVLDYLGLPHEGYAGRSLRPLMEGGTLAPALAYADQINGYDDNASMVAQRPDAAFLYTVCDGTWKLIYRPHMSEASELFDLARDPGEERNVLAEQRDVYLRLMAELARLDPWVLRSFPVLEPESQGARGALEQLGYTGDDGEADDVEEIDWWWTCPAHEGYRRETRLGPAGGDEHGIEGCTQPVVPRCRWPQ